MFLNHPDGWDWTWRCQFGLQNYRYRQKTMAEVMAHEANA
jgi:hypothetical protein